MLHFISFSFWYFIHFFVFKGMTYSSAGSLGIQGVEAIVELKLIFLFLSGFVLMSAFCFSRGAALRFQGESFFFFFDGLRKFLVFVGRCVCLLMCSFVVVVVVVFVFLCIYFSLVYFLNCYCYRYYIVIILLPSLHMIFSLENMFCKFNYHCLSFVSFSLSF